MQWVLDNWIWVLFGGGMIAMHVFGHGKHGGHGGQDKSCCGGSKTKPESQPSPPSTTSRIPNTGDDAGGASAAEKKRDL